MIQAIPFNQLADCHLAYNPVSAKLEPSILLRRYERQAGILYPTPGAVGTTVQFSSWQLNAGISLDGTLNMFLLREDGNNVYHVSREGRTTTTSMAIGVAFSAALFARAGGGRTAMAFQANSNLLDGNASIVDLNTGLITAAGTGQTLRCFATGIAGVWRIVMNSTLVVADTPSLAIGPVNGSGAVSYAGDGISGILVWGYTLSYGQTFCSPYFPAIADTNDTTGNGVAPAHPYDQNTTEAYYTYGGTNRYGDAIGQDDLEIPVSAIGTTPQTKTLFMEFIESGTIELAGNLGLVSYGCAYDGTGACLYIAKGTTGYKFSHYNGTTTVSCEVTPAPKLQDLVQLRGTFDATTGKVQLFQSINGGVEVAGTLSGAATPISWATSTLWLNGVGKTLRGIVAVRRVGFVANVKTSTQCQAVIPLAAVPTRATEVVEPQFVNWRPATVTGSKTLNSRSGTIRAAAAATTVTLTNSFIANATTPIRAWFRTSDTTAISLTWVTSAGSCVFTFPAAAAEVEIYWEVLV